MPRSFPRTALTVAALGIAGLSGVAVSGDAWAQARPATPAARAPSGDLALVQRHLEATRSLVADFSQTDRQGRVQSGRLTLKQPGRIRFQYAPGNPLLIVADGSALTMIDYQVRQVQRWPVRNSPLAVLIDPGANLMRFATQGPTSDPGAISVDVRDPRHPEYGMISMAFVRDPAGPAGLRLYGWVATDAQRNRTTVRLSNIRYNVPVEDSVFRWRDPRTQQSGPRTR